MRATTLMVTIISILTVTPVFTHVQYGEAAPGDVLLTIPNPPPHKEGEGKSEMRSTPQATGHVSSVQRMYKDAKVVIITGRAIGHDGEPSDLSVIINGIDFSMTVHPSLSSYAFGDGAGESALQTCDVLSQQIATYTQGARGIPEFDTQCVSLAGEAAILLIQAHPERYDIPTKQDTKEEKWLKEKRRILQVKVSSTDDYQQLKVQ